MFLDVQPSWEGIAAQARWQEKGQWQTMIIEKQDGSSGAILPGDAIILQAHTGNMIDVQGTAVQASWNDKGAWQTFVIENVAPDLEPAAHGNSHRRLADLILV